MADLDALAAATADHFRHIHRDVFLGDPAANPRLKVEVAAAEMADDVPVLVVVTPWMVNGMAVAPPGTLPDHLTVGARRAMCLANTIEPLGHYYSVTLVPDVHTLADHDAAMSAARALAGPFRDAVAVAVERGRVPDPGRRRLLRGGREE